jgi:beta-glucosidase
MGVYFGPSHLPKTYTAMGWPIEPDGLYEALMHITKTYGAPEIFISENGFATVDKSVSADALNDDGRVQFISDHLTFLQQAMASGARVSGYFIWALMDSFEWNDGTKWRFGLIAVDFETLQRTPKLSYCWYAELIRQNAAVRL